LRRGGKASADLPLYDGDLDMALLTSTLPVAFAWLDILMASAALFLKTGL
jgi:hypothetical protein